MSYGRALLVCVITLFSLGDFCPTFGADDDYTRVSLVGITILDVVVEDPSPSAAMRGLTKDAIKTDVELKLRLAGIKINVASSEYLYVNVNVADNGAAANIDVKLEQPVKLARNPAIAVVGDTWSRELLVTNPTAIGVRSAVKDEVDGFLNAWLAANQK